MPTPGKDETQKDFVKRCIPIVMDDGTAENNKQAVAICNQIWRDKDKKKDSTMRQWFSMKKFEIEDDEDETDDDKKKNGEGDEDEDKKKKKSVAEIVIYDEIGRSFWGESVEAKSFLQQLTDLGDIDDIALHINSPGGDVFDGVAIHNALKNHKANVTAHIDGIAASIASYIAMAADTIIMPENAFMLLHNASGFVVGTAEDMRSVANDLDRIDKAITATYATRSGQTPAKVRALLKEDRLMDAKEAKQLGYADHLAAPVKMAAHFPLRLLPQAAAETFRAHAEIVDDPPPPRPVHNTPTSPSPAQPGGEVVSFKAAKKTGIAEHKEYVDAVTDLCALAGMPERVGDFVRDDVPVADVRKQLMEARAATPQPMMPHHPLMEKKPPAKLWDKITDKLNARQR
jgi:ATP-dependent protease ClpP protease subunit